MHLSDLQNGWQISKRLVSHLRPSNLYGLDFVVNKALAALPRGAMGLFAVYDCGIS